MPPSRPVQGFIDSATLHGAFAALIVGKPVSSWPPWDLQSLLECTYLLLFENVSLVSGPTKSGVGGYGFDSELSKCIPELFTTRSYPGRASSHTKAWLERWPNRLENGWEKLLSDPDLPSWSERARTLFWIDHSRTNAGLFQSEYIPYIARIFKGSVSEGDLHRVRSLSAEPSVVRNWSKQATLEEAGEIANRAYLLSALIRGKHHEISSRQAGNQLIAHPLRRHIAGETAKPTSVDINDSEQYFVKMLIGSALLEWTAAKRIKAWGTYIQNARQAIRADGIRFPTDSTHAEQNARHAAELIELRGTNPWKESILNWAVVSSAAHVLSLQIGGWSAVGGVGIALGVGLASEMYGNWRGKTIGQDMVGLANTRIRFSQLAAGIPGRIERAFEPNVVT